MARGCFLCKRGFPLLPQTPPTHYGTQRLGMIPHEPCTREPSSARVRIARLEEALLKYGQYKPRCPIWTARAHGACACGLDAALEGRNE